MAKQILKSLNMNFIEEDTGGWASRTVEIRVFDGAFHSIANKYKKLKLKKYPQNLVNSVDIYILLQICFHFIKVFIF